MSLANFYQRFRLKKLWGGFGEVRAIRTLRMADNPKWQTPPSKLYNIMARNLYRQVRDALENKDLRSDEIIEEMSSKGLVD